MSTLNALLKNVPVEWKMVGDYVDYLQPTNYLVSSKNYHDDYKTPVLTAGKTFILGYTDESTGIFPAAKSPVIIFDDFTTANKWVDFDFKAKSSAMKILIPRDDTKIVLKYFYYWLSSCPSELSEGDHKRQWISSFSLKLIPIPYPNDPEKSLAIQQEIVRVLDGLSEQNKALTTALAQEIDQRKKQYEYYREELFHFEGKEVEWKKLKEISTFSNGKGHEKVISENGEYIVVNSKFISTEGKVIKRSNQQLSPVEKDDILMVMSDLPNGRALAKTFIVDDENKYTLNQRIGRIRVHANQRILPSFLNFLLNRNVQLLKYDNGIDQTNLKKGDIENLEVPIFLEKNDQDNTLMKQERIVRLLDQFDEATKNIVAQLEKEIELRNKQYEYYRNLLLSFSNV